MTVLLQTSVLFLFSSASESLLEYTNSEAPNLLKTGVCSNIKSSNISIILSATSGPEYLAEAPFAAPASASVMTVKLTTF